MPRRSSRRPRQSVQVVGDLPATSCVDESRRAERGLDARSVDPRDVRVGDERNRSVAGDELAERLERADRRRGSRRRRAPRRRRRGRQRRRPLRTRGRRSSYSAGTAASSRASGRPAAAHALPRRRRRRRRPGPCTARSAQMPRGSRRTATAPPPRATTDGSPSQQVGDDLLLDARGRPASPCSKRSGIVSRSGVSISLVERRQTGARAGRRPPRPSVDFPAPMKPTSATWRSSAVANRFARGTRCTPPTKSPSASPPNFSRAARASSNATAASATTASASTRRCRCARRAPRPARPVSRSTDCSGCISVGSGFIAARTTISSPFEMPASIPPARFVSRYRPRSSRWISSCASEPRSSASAKPSPISTPFTAWMPITAAASRASRRVSREA